MFNLGLGEIVIIAIIALLVFGPERLPEVARQAAKVYNQIRGVTDEVQRTIMAESRSITDPINETRREIESVTNPVKSIKAELNSTLTSIKSPSAPQAASRTVAPPVTVPTADSTTVPAQNGGAATPSYKPVSRAEVVDDNV